jgi:hypothetical protein
VDSLLTFAVDLVLRDEREDRDERDREEREEGMEVADSEPELDLESGLLSGVPVRELLLLLLKDELRE